MHIVNKKHVLAGAALMGTSIVEMLAVGGPCPLCVAGLGSGAFVIKNSIIG